MQAVAIKSNSISYPSHRQIISSHIVKAGLLLLIVASIFRGLAWSFITPPIYGVDEPQHFMYAENIGRSHMLRIEPSKKVPLNLWQLAHIEQFEEVRFRGHTLSLANQELIRQQIQSLNTSTQSESAYVVDDNRLVVTKGQLQRLPSTSVPSSGFLMRASVSRIWADMAVVCKPPSVDCSGCFNCAFVLRYRKNNLER